MKSSINIRVPAHELLTTGRAYQCTDGRFFTDPDDPDKALEEAARHQQLLQFTAWMDEVLRPIILQPAQAFGGETQKLNLIASTISDRWEMTPRPFEVTEAKVSTKACQPFKLARPSELEPSS